MPAKFTKAKFPITKKAQNAAYDLIISYQAFFRRVEQFKDKECIEHANSLRFWARTLREDQETIGIELVDDFYLNLKEDQANRFIDGWPHNEENYKLSA